MQARWAIRKRKKNKRAERVKMENESLREKDNISRERESYARGQSVREGVGDWFREVFDN